MRRSRLVAAAMLAGALGVAGVAIGASSDDDAGGPSGGRASAATDEPGATTTRGPLVFDAPGVPFRFEYPPTFAPVPAADLPPGYVAILGIDPINFIDVRLTAEQELSDAALRDEIGTALARPGVEVVSRSTAEADDVEFVTFSVTDSTSGSLSRSTLRFFRAGGKTWELGCQYDATGADTIRPACDDMLDTFQLRA